MSNGERGYGCLRGNICDSVLNKTQLSEGVTEKVKRYRGLRNMVTTLNGLRSGHHFGSNKGSHQVVALLTITYHNLGSNGPIVELI